MRQRGSSRDFHRRAGSASSTASRLASTPPNHRSRAASWSVESLRAGPTSAVAWGAPPPSESSPASPHSREQWNVAGALVAVDADRTCLVSRSGASDGQALLLGVSGVGISPRDHQPSRHSLASRSTRFLWRSSTMSGVHTGALTTCVVSAKTAEPSFMVKYLDFLTSKS